MSYIHKIITRASVSVHNLSSLFCFCQSYTYFIPYQAKKKKADDVESQN